MIIFWHFVLANFISERDIKRRSQVDPFYSICNNYALLNSDLSPTLEWKCNDLFLCLDILLNLYFILCPDPNPSRVKASPVSWVTPLSCASSVSRASSGSWAACGSWSYTHVPWCSRAHGVDLIGDNTAMQIAAVKKMTKFLAI